jgi:hypothetical protein
LNPAMDRGKGSLGRVAERKGCQTTFEKRRADLFKEASELSELCGVRVAALVFAPGETKPAIWPPSPEEAAAILQGHQIFLLRQEAERLRRELRIMKLVIRAREVFVLEYFFAENHGILDGLSVDLAADVRAVAQLRKKVTNSQMASQAPSMAAPDAGGVGVSAPVDIDDGEPRRGSYLLAEATAIMADESGGVQPSDADLERFLWELLFK